MSIVNKQELHNFCIYVYEELIKRARKNGGIYNFDEKETVKAVIKSKGDHLEALKED